MSVDDTKRFLQGGLQTVVRKNKAPLSIVYNGAWYISTNVVSITKFWKIILSWLGVILIKEKYLYLQMIFWYTLGRTFILLTIEYS